MKNRASILLILASIITIGLSSCIKIYNKDASYSYDDEYSEENIIFSKIDTLDNKIVLNPEVNYFNVKLNGLIDVRFIKSDINKVEIQANNQSNLEKLFVNEDLEGDRPTIKIYYRHKEHMPRIEDRIKINFYYKDMSSLDLSSSVKAKFEGALAKNLSEDNSELDIDMSGASSISGLILSEASKFSLELSGSSTISDININANEADIDLSGASTIENTNLNLKSSLFFELSGSSKVENISAESNSIDLNEYGASSITKATFKSNGMDINLLGSSELNINIDNNSYTKASIIGASDLILKGITESLSINAEGSSSANIKELKYKTINIEESGAGKVYK